VEERKDVLIGKRGCFEHVEVEGTWQRTQLAIVSVAMYPRLLLVQNKEGSIKTSFHSSTKSALTLVVTPYYVVVIQ
jgi:hypothetical protein